MAGAGGAAMRRITSALDTVSQAQIAASPPSCAAGGCRVRQPRSGPGQRPVQPSAGDAAGAVVEEGPPDRLVSAPVTPIPAA